MLPMVANRVRPLLLRRAGSVLTHQFSALLESSRVSTFARPASLTAWHGDLRASVISSPTPLQHTCRAAYATSSASQVIVPSRSVSLQRGEDLQALSKVTKSVLPPRERVDTGGWLAKELCKLTSTQGVGVVLSGEQISPSVLKHLLHHLRKRNQWERSIEVMDWTQHKRNKLQTPTAKHYTIVISACRDAGELQAAIKVRCLQFTSRRYISSIFLCSSRRNSVR